MSEARQRELYDAIAGPITDLRLERLRNRGSITSDNELFDLENEIWRRVHAVLNLEGPA